MRHSSIKLETPCEFINVTPINPLISKCEIKVCYVGEDPNRNRSVITKEVATEMANSLPGSPIVGYYNEDKEDFEEHNRIIDISNGEIKIKDTTRPYGFVDLNAKVWFQKFLDDGINEREYLMTEGYLWTGQYPESKRILEQGNGQSMELSEEFLDATWTKDSNGKPKFFIINEAIISKLCILGEEVEPCFESASITKPTIQFSFDEDFKVKLFSMMNELKELMKEGGAPVFTTFAVEIGDALWCALYSYLEEKFPGEDSEFRCSKYWVESIWEEGQQKFAILKHRSDSKLYRLDFSWTEAGFASDASLVEVEKTYVPVSEEPVFNAAEVEAFEATRYAVGEEQPLEEELPVENTEEVEVKEEEEEVLEEEPVQYNLEEISEYIELKNQFEELEQKFNLLTTEHEGLKEEVVSLREFKSVVDKKEKQAMIDSFYMLSAEDKADVVANIDSYSVEDIEAKLSVICVRNKVDFRLDDENNEGNPTVYNLDDSQEDLTPAWVKAAMAVAKSMN